MQRNEEQNGCVQLEFADRMQPIEHTAEIALPDYRSEISRLLWVRPLFLPPSRFVGSGKIEFSGPICYHILYMGPDGNLYGAESEDTYAFSVPRDSMEGFDAAQGMEITAELVPDAVISRVMGPRKLSVRCRLRARMRGYASKSIVPQLRGEGADGDKVHRLCDAIENGRMAASECENFQISDEIELENGDGGEVRLIASHGSLFMPEVSAADGEVCCRGEAWITLLCCREGGEAATPYTVSRRIPFEKSIPLAGISPDWHACAKGEVGQISTELEGNKAVVTVNASLTAQCQCDESILLYKDVFLPGCRAECRREEGRFWLPGFCGNRNFSISGERPFSEIGIPGDATVLDAVADAEIRERQTESDRTVLLGEMRCHVLYHTGGEYATGEFSIPFRGILDEQVDGMSVDCRVLSCRVSSVGDTMRADAEIGLAVRAHRDAPAKFLAEAVFAPAEAPARADVELCYPGPGESLWEIGKRYGISPDTLAAANGLSGEAPGEASSLAGVRYLLVP